MHHAQFVTPRVRCTTTELIESKPEFQGFEKSFLTIKRTFLPLQQHLTGLRR